MNIHFGTPTNTDLLEINDKILELTKEYDLIQGNPCTESKRSFYNLQTNILLPFYYQSCSLVLWEIFAKNKEAFPPSTNNVYLIGMIESIKSHKSVMNLIKSNNRSILIDSWSMFETTITELCEKYIINEELEEFLSHSDTYIKIEKIVGPKLTEVEKSKLKSECKLNKISSQSIENRYRKLYDIFFGKEYKKHFIEDLKFLKFYLTLRNCMHHNFIYLNKEDYSFPFEGIMIEFTNGKPVSFKPDVPYDFFFLLTLQLIEVTNRIFELIDKNESKK